MKRFDAIQAIARALTDELVVCNLGYPARELFAIADRPGNFYMLGSMGLASSIALGMAIARPDRRVLCIEGDGSVLMNLGSLATIANANPPNLLIVVIDNGTYGSTGDQPTATSGKTRLDTIARGAGFDHVTVLQEPDEIAPLLNQDLDACRCVLIKTEPGNADVGQVLVAPEAIKKRFVRALHD